MVRFSPPAWGWSVFHSCSGAIGGVFPTRVGMVRLAPVTWPLATSFPHPRGDGPAESRSGAVAGVFSPPAWGWSAGQTRAGARGSVFPTRVGMVRSWRTKRKMSSGFPHPRGDGPIEKGGSNERRVFSPPAWGWSGVSFALSSQNEVFPTRVGMVRSSPSASTPAPRFPHPRGDGPGEPARRRGGEAFSPPAWGWSVGGVDILDLPMVFPTRVGMVRRPRRT